MGHVPFGHRGWSAGDEALVVGPRRPGFNFDPTSAHNFPIALTPSRYGERSRVGAADASRVRRALERAGAREWRAIVQAGRM
jgi:hypothetical protein